MSMLRALSLGSLAALIAASAWSATITVPGDQPTIQAAVSAAAPGDTIQVAAGTYVENVTVDRALVLLGAQANVTPVDSGRAGGESTIQGTLTIAANEVTVNGFEVAPSGVGIDWPANAANRSGLTLTSNYVHSDTSMAGVYLLSPSTVSGVIGAANVTISDNLISVGAPGSLSMAAVLVGGGASGTAIYDGLVVTDNELSSPGGGFGLGGFLAAWAINAPVITGNTVSNTGYGIWLQGLASAVIEENVFDHTGAYALAIDADGASVKNNTFQNCYPAESDGSASWGLVLLGGAFGGSCSDIDVRDNDFRYNNNANASRPESGALVMSGCDAGSIVFRNNNFIDGGQATGAVALSSEAVGVVDAENNWWGSAEGPSDPVGTIEVPTSPEPAAADMVNAEPAGSLGGAVSEGVDYYPWLGSLALHGEGSVLAWDKDTMKFYLCDDPSNPETGIELVSGQSYTVAGETLVCTITGVNGDRQVVVTNAEPGSTPNALRVRWYKLGSALYRAYEWSTVGGTTKTAVYQRGQTYFYDTQTWENGFWGLAHTITDGPDWDVDYSAVKQP